MECFDKIEKQMDLFVSKYGHLPTEISVGLLACSKLWSASGDLLDITTDAHDHKNIDLIVKNKINKNLKCTITEATDKIEFRDDNSNVVSFSL